MPNWCKGDLKVRGTKESIERFILEALQPCGFMGLVDEKPTIERDRWSMTVNLDKAEYFYIEETRRHFVEQQFIEFYYPEDDEETVLVLEIMTAWSVDVESLQVLSKKYNVDFKILSFENGMQFNQDIEVVDGEIIKNDVIKFEDYDWECIRPHMGG